MKKSTGFLLGAVVAALIGAEAGLTAGCAEASFLDQKMDDGNLLTGYGKCDTGWFPVGSNPSATATHYSISQLMR